MSPSCRTMPPISWTSKRRTPSVRLNASRTEANASKTRSSRLSPFSSRCRNSTVFAARSASESCSYSGSSVPMYAACSASRLRRRPSPARRTFSREPSCWAIEDRVPGALRSERRGSNFPLVAVETLGAHDVAASLELGDRSERALAVDEERVARQLDRVALRRIPELDDLDSSRLHRPEVVALSRSARTVRRLQLLLDRVRERLQRRVGSLLHEHRAVGKDDERCRIAFDAGRLHHLRRIPLARTLHTVDADLARRCRRHLGRGPVTLGQPAFAGEPFVQRLLPSEQAQRSASSACLSIFRFAALRSRSSFTCRRSFSASSSMDAFMSRVASRARSVCPFNRTVASATWLSAMDGFFSTASSTSTRASLLTTLSSLLNFRSAYNLMASLTSRFLPLTRSSMSPPEVADSTLSSAQKSPRQPGRPLPLAAPTPLPRPLRHSCRRRRPARRCLSPAESRQTRRRRCGAVRRARARAGGASPVCA